MNTTELFQFNFVDRATEQIKMEKFLSTSNNSVLWIRGKRGFGKTKFFNYVFKNHKNDILCYIDIKTDESSTDILSKFILELQTHSNYDFISYVRKNYKQFYNKTYQKSDVLVSEIFPQVSKIISIILDFAYYVTTYSDENKNTLEIINDYIETISKHKNICICIDNFSRCDRKTAEIFFQIFKKFIYEKNFKACIITTDEDLSTELKEQIFINVPYTVIEIEKFNESRYFRQIMDPLFELDEFTSQEFEYLYNKCYGSPKTLATTISKLLEKNGIVLHNGKAKIDKSLLMEILAQSRIRFEDNDFDTKQKWVIFSYLCLPEQISAEVIEQLALYISKKCFFYTSYNDVIFKNELLTLVENKVLNYDAKSGNISTCHDLDYIELMDIFKESQLEGLFSQYTYEFLLQNPQLSFQEALLCRHSREANIPGWETRNFRYGKKLFHNNQIYESQKIFSYLEKSLHKLHPMRQLLIALVDYESGNYQLAIKKFQLIQPEILKFHRAQFYYYFYLGKSLNNVGKTEEATQILEKALGHVEKDSFLYVQTLNVLHMYYIEIPGKFEKAQNIFTKIQNSYENVYSQVWANTMRGCQNFLDPAVCLDILDKAAAKLDDEVEKAYIQTTKGFVFMKLSEINQAKECFEQASQIIKRLKIHEFSYAANNLAVCYMLQKNYATANEILLQALLWNRTNYGNLVLYTHLMICSLYLNLEDETLYYFNLLKEYIENHKIVDSIIIRKIYMNLAIVCQKRGEHILEKSYFRKVKSYIQNTSSEWRYNNLVNDISNHLERPASQYLRVLDFEPWFLIYAHD